MEIKWNVIQIPREEKLMDSTYLPNWHKQL